MELQFCDSMSRFDSSSIDDSIYLRQQFLDADLSYRSPAANYLRASSRLKRAPVRVTSGYTPSERRFSLPS